MKECVILKKYACEETSDELTGGDKGLGVSGCLGTNLAELLEVFPGEVVAREVKHGILQGAGMSIRQDKAITVHPRGVRGRINHRLVPQEMGHGRATHGSTWMARLGRLDLIGRQGPNRVNAFEL